MTCSVDKTNHCSPSEHYHHICTEWLPRHVHYKVTFLCTVRKSTRLVVKKWGRWGVFVYCIPLHLFGRFRNILKEHAIICRTKQGYVITAHCCIQCLAKTRDKATYSACFCMCGMAGTFPAIWPHIKLNYKWGVLIIFIFFRHIPQKMDVASCAPQWQKSYEKRKQTPEYLCWRILCRFRTIYTKLAQICIQ
jgi:hypothetical protein